MVGVSLLKLLWVEEKMELFRQPKKKDFNLNLQSLYMQYMKRFFARICSKNMYSGEKIGMSI